MKKILIILVSIILTSCDEDRGEYMFTDSVDISKMDSTRYKVTIQGESYINRNLDTNLLSYALERFESGVNGTIDTCIQASCVQIRKEQHRKLFLFYVFTTYNGRLSVTMREENDMVKFTKGDSINVFVSKKILSHAKDI